MANIAVLKIRLNGIIGNIRGYTSEPSVAVIVNALTSALSENDYDMIVWTCKEIAGWYTRELGEMVSNQFVYNKDVHRRNVTLINSIISELEDEDNGYKNEFKKQNSEMDKKTGGVSEDTDGINELTLLINRFHRVVIQLRNRRSGKETIDVSDEYDVQDLLHALLHVYFDDIRPEEWVPSIAGSASRQDFLLKKEKIVIETKKTRKGLDNKRLGDELIVDIARYKQHPDCKTLVCFVYDPENRIQNPRGFENDLSEASDTFSVIVCIRP